MNVIIYTNESGNVSVTIPTGEISIEEVLVKDCPDHAIIVDSAELPEEYNDFFNAWELINGQVEVNLIKAKEITKARLRAEREPLLQAQDILFQIALESGADTSDIVAEKQRLRDITNLVDSVASLDELRSLKVLGA